ncbi:MAG: hypothetical protein IJK40_04965 [Clostridia bacterium]|nr:hypothetical protein [Clostridia bacterium]
MIRLCKNCGEPYDSETGTQYCCGDCEKRATKGAPKTKKREPDAADRFGAYLEAQEKARAKGRELSYGQYQAMQSAGKGRKRK